MESAKTVLLFKSNKAIVIKNADQISVQATKSLRIQEIVKTAQHLRKARLMVSNVNQNNALQMSALKKMVHAKNAHPILKNTPQATNAHLTNAMKDKLI